MIERHCSGRRRNEFGRWRWGRRWWLASGVGIEACVWARLHEEVNALGREAAAALPARITDPVRAAVVVKVVWVVLAAVDESLDAESCEEDHRDELRVALELSLVA